MIILKFLIKLITPNIKGSSDIHLDNLHGNETIHDSNDINHIYSSIGCSDDVNSYFHNFLEIENINKIFFKNPNLISKIISLEYNNQLFSEF